MQDPSKAIPQSNHDERLRTEIERANAKLRHFRGVAASVLNDAQKVFEEICEACNDPRTCEQILEDVDEMAGRSPVCGWPEFREKLNLLGHHIDYTKRLLEGSIDGVPKKKGGT